MLENILALLGLTETTAQIDAILSIVQTRMLSKLKVMSGEEFPEVPIELEGIVVEVCVQRFNRIGSEGNTSHSVDGETMNFAADDYFTPYEADITAYVNSLAADGADTHCRFL